jgi:hypothetical protein
MEAVSSHGVVGGLRSRRVTKGGPEAGSMADEAIECFRQKCTIRHVHCQMAH